MSECKLCRRPPPLDAVGHCSACRPRFHRRGGGTRAWVPAQHPVSRGELSLERWVQRLCRARPPPAVPAHSPTAAHLALPAGGASPPPREDASPPPNPPDQRHAGGSAHAAVQSHSSAPEPAIGTAVEVRRGSGTWSLGTLVGHTAEGKRIVVGADGAKQWKKVVLPASVRPAAGPPPPTTAPAGQAAAGSTAVATQPAPATAAAPAAGAGAPATAAAAAVPPAGGAGHAEKLRIDPADGLAYTRAEFEVEYGGTVEWEAARTYTPPKTDPPQQPCHPPNPERQAPLAARQQPQPQPPETGAGQQRRPVQGAPAPAEPAAAPVTRGHATVAPPPGLSPAELFEVVSESPTPEKAALFARKLCPGGPGGVHYLHDGMTAAVLVAAISQEGTKGRRAAEQRRAACLCCAALCAETEAAGAAYLLPLGEPLLAACAARQARVASAALAALDALVAHCGRHACCVCVDHMVGGLSRSAPSSQKAAALRQLTTLARLAPEALAWELPRLVSVAAEAVHEAVPEVVAAGVEALRAFGDVITNPDMCALKPLVLQALGDPARVPAAVDALASTTFVAPVHRPELALVSPLLVRALRERQAALVRRCARITENLSKLVERASEAAPLLPELIPALEKALEVVPDPECRSVCARAHSWLLRLRAKLGASSSGWLDAGELRCMLAQAGLADHAASELIAALCARLAERGGSAPADWSAAVLPFATAAGVPEASAAAMADTLRQAAGGLGLEGHADSQAPELLCECCFSLAYGTRTLLRDATLVLHRGCCYGIVGENGSGKSTLLRAIAEGRVEGFPSPDAVRVALVEAESLGPRHAEHSAASCVEYLQRLSGLAGREPSWIAGRLRSDYGFQGTGPSPDSAVGSLSGGWLMKLELAGAMLCDPDVLLLDEPTNHLDPEHARWLRQWLREQSGRMACLVVSHDTELLQHCVTHIYRIGDMKLHFQEGGLDARTDRDFSELRRTVWRYRHVSLRPTSVRDAPLGGAPELRRLAEGEEVTVCDFFVDDSGATWARLQEGGDTDRWCLVRAATGRECLEPLPLPGDTFAFRFPPPAPIESGGSRTRVLVKIDNCSFTYDGATRPAVAGATLRVSMATRAVCIGANGAGKSTLVRLISGELAPQEGQVWRHPSARIAHVAQHAFSHIESHLEKTPNEYVRWRYSGQVDKEGTEGGAAFAEAARAARLPRTWEWLDDDGGLRRRSVGLECLTGARRVGAAGGWEYRARFIGDAVAQQGGWLGPSQLHANGCGELLRMVIERIQREERAQERPPTEAVVARHLAHVGIDPEVGTHTRIRMLSSGQKVKVVVAACLWGDPHVVVLDEPTNYLDREALSALAAAVREYQGGVVMVTHQREYGAELATERWEMAEGRLQCSGGHSADAAAGGGPRPAVASGEPSRKERKAREKSRKRAQELGLPWEED
eukprot:TRINITY_DN2805_c0_g2_i1.p1 TRINITY_DN2805_c0_g2~~TRINITY_DN2805_c0_g2_i1.p1  ORF type:complete len:1428 (+),score=282.51 TRINITY_DN2805_c0_g2_i1:77-4360(+)